MDSVSRRVFGVVALMWLLATITLGLQSWIGDQTIYSKSLEHKREEFHFAILANEAPGGAGWGAAPRECGRCVGAVAAVQHGYRAALDERVAADDEFDLFAFAFFALAFFALAFFTLAFFALALA